MQDDHIKAVKTHAAILIETLKPHGVALKKTEAIEIISQLQSRLDWNRLRAKLKTPVAAKPQANQEATLPDAMLVVGRGMEKSEILKTLFELECAEGVTAPILVSIAGKGHTHGLGADIFFSRLPRITVSYDGSGIVSVNGSDHCNGKGLLVNLTCSVKGSRAGAGYALSQLFNCHSSSLKEGIGLPLGSLLIDDLDQITDDLEFFEAAGAIREYAQSKSDTFRRLVATLEAGAPKNRQSCFGMNFFYPVKLEQGVPEFANPKQIIRVPKVVSSNLDIFPFESDSLSDRSIVADICGWIWYLNSRYGDIGVGKGVSRAASVPGRSLWFSDLRASLIR
jgi:hypothetical protein